MKARRPAWPVERTLLLPVAAVLLAVLGTAAVVSTAERKDTTAAVTRLVSEIARDSEAAPLDPASAREIAKVLETHDGVARAEIGAIHGNGTIISTPIRLTTGTATLQVETNPPASTSAIPPLAIAAIAAVLLAAVAAHLIVRRTLLAIGHRIAEAEELPPQRGYRRVRADWSRYGADLLQEKQATVDRDRLLTELKVYFKLHGLSADWDAIRQTPDERLVTSLAMICPFEPSEKQALLEAPTLAERAQVMTAIIEMAVLDRSKDGDGALN
jgi:hypothetical protein